MKKYIVIIFFALFCICSFLGGVHFNDFITEWNILILIFFFLGLYPCLLDNQITKELFLLFFLIILVPLIFFSGLSLIDDTFVSSINDWIGFLGAYFGVIGAIGGIWWQLNEEKRGQQLTSLKIFKFYFEKIFERDTKTCYDIILPLLNVNYGHIPIDDVEMLLYDNQFSLLYENITYISTLNIGKKVLSILDNLYSINRDSKIILNNSLSIRETFSSCEKYFENDDTGFYKELGDINTYINIKNPKDVEPIKTKFKILFDSAKDENIKKNILKCLNHVILVEYVLYYPNLCNLQNLLKDILKDINNEIKKLS